MFRTWLSLSLSYVLTVVAAASAQEPGKSVDADFVLFGGTLFDGAGGEGVTGDLAIKDGRIVAVGQFARGEVGRAIDCQGLFITPGFIDLHNHSDRKMASAATRANVNFLTQGCTTIVTGNCGGGPIEVKEFLDDVDAAGAGTNVVHLLPHGSLRSHVMGSVRRAPTDDELAEMRKLLVRAMNEGAWGMSTGLIYVPGTYAETDELVALSEVVAEHGGIYASHIRNEGAGLLDAVREAIEIGRRAKLPVHISHYKASGQEAWGSIRAATSIIEQAHQAGQKVTADQYPYIASSTSLEATVIPTWAREGGQKALLTRLENSETRSKLLEEIEEKLKNKKLMIASYRPRQQWVGRFVHDIAAGEQKPPLEIVLEITRAGGAAIVNFGMNEEDVRFAMQLPWVATASDGGARLPAADQPHPRSYGTFSRKIGRYAIEEKVLSASQAIRSASGLPADILGLTDRGYLKPGLVADVVAFDPAEFRDRATFENPYQFSTGVRYVFVTGEPAIYAGIPTGALAGRALRHKSPGEEGQEK